MRDADTTWTIKSFEDNGQTTIREGVSHRDAIEAIYRAMGAWYPAHRKVSRPVEIGRDAESRETEKIAA